MDHKMAVAVVTFHYKLITDITGQINTKIHIV